mmetsp:Transcript_37278/g.87735  ORF Transcript_37278/g.87735 Transcript_37278/m.87735 type:complete len:280 (-) Transcript_37278:206-1045(-)
MSFSSASSRSFQVWMLAAIFDNVSSTWLWSVVLSLRSSARLLYLLRAASSAALSRRKLARAPMALLAASSSLPRSLSLCCSARSRCMCDSVDSARFWSSLARALIWSNFFFSSSSCARAPAAIALRLFSFSCDSRRIWTSPAFAAFSTSWRASSTFISLSCRAMLSSRLTCVTLCSCRPSSLAAWCSFLSFFRSPLRSSVIFDTFPKSSADFLLASLASIVSASTFELGEVLSLLASCSFRSLALCACSSAAAASLDSSLNLSSSAFSAVFSAMYARRR